MADRNSFVFTIRDNGIGRLSSETLHSEITEDIVHFQSMPVPGCLQFNCPSFIRSFTCNASFRQLFKRVMNEENSVNQIISKIPKSGLPLNSRSTTNETLIESSFPCFTN